MKRRKTTMRRGTPCEHLGVAGGHTCPACGYTMPEAAFVAYVDHDTGRQSQVYLTSGLERLYWVGTALPPGLWIADDRGGYRGISSDELPQLGRVRRAEVTP